MSGVPLTSKSSKVNLKTLFSYKNYCLVLLANIVSRFGDSVDLIAYPWMVYELTGSKVLMGSLYAINFLPNVILSPFAGVIIDHYDNRKLCIIGDIGRGLTVFVTGLLFYLHLLMPWHLFAFTLLNSTFEVFSNPSKETLLPYFIPKELFLSATAFNKTAATMAELLGFGFAGAIIAIWGIWGAIWIDSVSFFVSAFIFTTLRLNISKGEKKQFKDIRFLSDIKVGLDFLLKNKLLLIRLFSLTLANFGLAFYTALMPFYVKESLQHNMSALGYLRFTFSFGLIFSGLFISQYGARFKRSTLTVLGIFLLGSSYFLLGSFDNIFIAFIFSFGMGLSFQFLYAFNSYILEITPTHILGRVKTLNKVVFMCSIPLGGFLAGISSQYIQVSVLYQIMGFFIMIVALLPLTNKEFMQVK